MRPPQWFQIAPVLPAGGSGHAERRVHAKAFGTTLTACGLQAANMQREWDLPFDIQGRGACPDCKRHIAETVRAAQMSRSGRLDRSDGRPSDPAA